MSLHTHFYAPRTTLSGRIQIGHKSGLFIYYLSVNIKPPRHRFGLSLCLGLANRKFKSLKMQLDDKEDEIEFLNIVIIDKDSKISRLEKEILSKNTHIETIKTKLVDQLRSPDND